MPWSYPSPLYYHQIFNLPHSTSSQQSLYPTTYHLASTKPLSYFTFSHYHKDFILPNFTSTLQSLYSTLLYLTKKYFFLPHFISPPLNLILPYLISLPQNSYTTLIVFTTTKSDKGGPKYMTHFCCYNASISKLQLLLQEPR